MDPIPTCACGCGLPLPIGARKSRAYATDNCRLVAMRRRRRDERLAGGTVAAAPTPASPVKRSRGHAGTAPLCAHPDERVAVAVLELRSVAAAFARLAIEARPKFAWRCEAIAGAVFDVLDEHFPEPGHDG